MLEQKEKAEHLANVLYRYKTLINILHSLKLDFS